jgi:hypothetical protein
MNEILIKEYPHCTIPEIFPLLEEIGIIQNDSWHHDGAASYIFGPMTQFEDYKGCKYKLWIDAFEPSERDGEFRYSIGLNDQGCSNQVFLDTEDIKEVIQYIYQV